MLAGIGASAKVAEIVAPSGAASLEKPREGGVPLRLPPVPAATAIPGVDARGGNGEHSDILASLERDLTRSVFDGSPGVVTRSELRHAHQTLMGLEPSVFSEVLRALRSDLLSTYLSELAEQFPFRLDGPAVTPLIELAQKMAAQLSVDRSGSTAFVDGLNGDARRQLETAFLCLPTAVEKAELARRLGPACFEKLLRGDGPHGAVGAPMWQEGMFFDGSDVPRFLELYAQAKAGALPKPDGFDDVDYAFVKGFFGNQGVGYFHRNLHALESSWGLEATMLEFNTGERHEVNAEKIFAQVRELYEKSGGKKLVLVGHSKGGLDTREALRRHPEMKQMVAGIVFIQPALSSQIATSVHTGDGRFEPFIDPLLRIIGGNYGVVESLAYDRDRTEALRTEPFPGDEIPTVVVATSYDEPASVMRTLGKAMEKAFCAPSDGVVALGEQASGFAGASVVVLPGVADHVFSIWSLEGAVHVLTDLLIAGDVEGFKREAKKLAGLIEAVEGVQPWAIAWRQAIRQIGAWAERLTSQSDDVRWDRFVERSARRLRRFAKRFDSAMHGARSVVGKPPADIGALTLAAMALLHEKMAAQKP